MLHDFTIHFAKTLGENATVEDFSGQSTQSYKLPGISSRAYWFT